MKHLPPCAQVGFQRVQPRPTGPLGRDARVIDQRIKPPAQTGANFFDLGDGVVWVGQIDLDMRLGAPTPRTFLWERLTRTGDHAPTLGAKTAHRGMANTAACPGQQQCFLMRAHDAPLWGKYLYDCATITTATWQRHPHRLTRDRLLRMPPHEKAEYEQRLDCNCPHPFRGFALSTALCRRHCGGEIWRQRHGRCRCHGGICPRYRADAPSWPEPCGGAWRWAHDQRNA